MYKIIENEVELTHAHVECIIAAILYDYIILCCLYFFEENTNENDTTIILYKISEFFESLLKSNNIRIRVFKQNIENIQKIFNEINNFSSFESGKNSNLISEIGKKFIGFYMHAFKIIFFVLRFYQDFLNNDKENIYRNIMFFICNLGGDTDTNCCIAGGVVGALVKLGNIHEDYLYPHLLFCTEGLNTNQKRWIIYSPSYLGYYGIKLFDLMENPNDRKEY